MIRLFQTLLIGGIIFFCILLVTFVVFIMGAPLVLISFEFNNDVRLFALLAALYPGLSFLASPFFIFSKISPRKQYHKGRPTKERVIVQIDKSPKHIKSTIFVALCFGMLSYLISINMAASLFHMSAPKEYVEIKANMSSAWPDRKDIRSDCKYQLIFDTPKISPDIQRICLSKEQWPYYRELDFSKENTIIIYGEKSYFGYELHCCK